MMVNRTLFIALILLFLLPWCLGLGRAPEEQKEDIHVSEEVEIDKQENGEKEGEAEPKQDAVSESRPENGDADEESETGDAADKEQETEIDSAGLDTDREATSAEKELGELMLTEQEALLANKEKYYTRKNRVDPFEPFIHREESESDDEEGEKVQRREPQTPLERMALSQLKLTGILRIQEADEAVAMVEDQDGKGYVIRKGTYIGNNGGQVVDILDDRIIIEEKYKDAFGKVAVREIEKKIQN